MKKRIMMFSSVFLGLAISVLFLAVRSEGAGPAVISEGKSVTAHYTLTVDGKVVDSSRGKKPIQFTVGSKKMIPGFEKGIMGMKAGGKKSFKVSPIDGYGVENPKAFQNVKRTQLPPEITPKVGMVLYTQGKNGQEIPARIAEVKKDLVVMNLNHPLAGKTLNFDVEVLEIK